MLKTPAINYKVFLFERVKKKTLFLHTETYPLQIRLTAGAKTVYIKSYFFTLLQLKKYQQAMEESSAACIIDSIMRLEEELLEYLRCIHTGAASLERIRSDYGIFSHDILHQLDEDFKHFLVDFFYTERLPAYAMFIKNDGANHRSEFILSNLEKSLKPAVYRQLLAMAAAKAPPYIPFNSFWRKKIFLPIPLFPLFYWTKGNIQPDFIRFLLAEFPGYTIPAVLSYINKQEGIIEYFRR